MFKFTFKFTLPFTSTGISLGGHNLGTCYAMKLKFGMLTYPDLSIQLCASCLWVMPWVGA